MKRNEFLKGLGIVGLGSLLPFKGVSSPLDEEAGKATGSCALIPSETAGPFPLDLTTNNAATYFRQDLREDRTGVELKVKMKIIGKENCLPMQNVRVNIWHCDKDGIYSGYAGGMNQGGSADTTWLRGYQMTDANGETNFVTIFPGHYDGRSTHIHFQVYVNAAYAAVSQFTWTEAVRNAFYTAHSGVYTEGVDTQTLASDNVFSDGYTLQLATLTDNGDGTYSAYIEVTINGSGSSASTGIRNYEGETGGHFKLGQNFPNPYTDKTTVPFVLNTQGAVQVDIYDLNARKVATIDKGTLSPGDYTMDVDCRSLGIPVGNYIYQLQVTTSKGAFRQCKMMTALK